MRHASEYVSLFVEGLVTRSRDGEARAGLTILGKINKTPTDPENNHKAYFPFLPAFSCRINQIAS